MTEDNLGNGVRKRGEMPFLHHIEELRQRLIRIIATILAFSIIAYVFADYLLDYLVKPIGTVYFREPTGAFSVRIKVSLFAGLAAAIPVVLYQLWKFIVPGLKDREIRFLIPVTVLGTLFFFLGASFCFLFVVPAAMKILQSFATENIRALIDVSEYFSFVFWMCIAFGGVFELPIIAYFLGKIGMITAGTLRRGRRIAIVIIVIVAAVITPTPDVFNQMLLAVPLYILYEVSIIVVHFTGKRKDTAPVSSG